MKKIGIVGWKTGENSFGVTIPYLHWASQFGQVEIITPGREIKPIDLLILPGGADISPSYYNEVPGFHTGSTDVHKQFFLENNLADYIDAGIPIFGICLGMQQLNVHFGGSMNQHAWSAYSNPRSQEVETFAFSKEFAAELASVKLTGVRKTNSMHHQIAIQVPDCFDILAYSLEASNVEIIRHKTLPIIGYQGHPEETFCSVATYLMKTLCAD